MPVPSSFTTKRIIRLVGALCVVLLFGAAQLWQSEGKLSLPSTETASLEGTEQYYTASTTRGVLALVTRTVDGDTIDAKIESSGEVIKVRFLGMNTPESVDPRRPVRCFGKEASNRLKELIEGKQVLLIDDPKADDRDKYGRWLRNIVRVEDNLDVNATLVAQGYASAYLSFPLDAKRKAQIRALEEEAKTGQRGLWSPSTCGGKK